MAIQVLNELKTVIGKCANIVENYEKSTLSSEYIHTYHSAAEYLNIPVRRVYKLAVKGIIKSIGFHRSRRFAERELDEYRATIDVVEAVFSEHGGE